MLEVQCPFFFFVNIRVWSSLVFSSCSLSLKNFLVVHYLIKKSLNADVS